MLEELVSLIFYGNGETKFRKFWTFFDSRCFKKLSSRLEIVLISMIVIAIRLVFFKNQHKRSFEHERARKRPTDTSEANSAQHNSPIFGSD